MALPYQSYGATPDSSQTGNPADPAPTTAPVPAPFDPSSVVVPSRYGLTGADQYNIQRLTRAHTYLAGALGQGGYADLAAATGLAPTDWNTQDAQIQALGGQPGYGSGIGDLFNHMIASGTVDKLPVADIKTLKQTLINQGFLPPGTPVNGTWDDMSQQAIRRWDDAGFQANKVGMKIGGASFGQFLGYLNEALPSHAVQALVGTAKFLFGGIAHTVERTAISAAHQAGGMVENLLPATPWTGGFTGVQQSPETVAALQAHGLATGKAGAVEDLSSVLAVLPLLRGAGVLTGGIRAAVAQAGEQGLLTPVEGTVAKGIGAKALRARLARAARNPVAVGDLLNSYAARPLSLQSLGESLLSRMDQVAAAKSTALGQIVTTALFNAPTQVAIGERIAGAIASGDVLPNVHDIAGGGQSPLSNAIQNSATLGYNWRWGPFGEAHPVTDKAGNVILDAAGKPKMVVPPLGNPLDLSAFIWAPTKALPFGKGSWTPPTLGEMADSLANTTPIHDTAPITYQSGLSQQALIDAAGSAPYLTQFMRYVKLQATIYSTASQWVRDVKGLNPGDAGWEAALKTKTQSLSGALKVDEAAKEAAIRAATPAQTQDQFNYIFAKYPALMQARGQGAPVLEDFFAANNVLRDVSAADATVTPFGRGSGLWAKANPEAVGRGVDPLFPTERAPAPATPSPRPLPVLKAEENYVRSLSHYTDTLHRETDVTGALTMLEGGERGLIGAKPLHFANTPTLALGQHENVGVHLEVDPGAFQGHVNLSKPGAQAAYAAGEAELIATASSATDVAGSIRRATIDPGVARASELEHELQAKGYVRSEGEGGGSVWTRQDLAVPPPIVAGPGSATASSYAFGERVGKRMAQPLGPDEVVAFRRVDNELVSAQQLGDFKTRWDRLSSVNTSLSTRINTLRTDANAPIVLPKGVQQGDLEAAGFLPPEIDSMRNPNNKALVGATMTPAQASRFADYLANEMRLMTSKVKDYYGETAKMTPRQISRYLSKVFGEAPRDVTLNDAETQQMLADRGYQPIAMHPNTLTMNHVGPGVADALADAERVSPLLNFLGQAKTPLDDATRQSIRVGVTRNELAQAAKDTGMGGVSGDEVIGMLRQVATQRKGARIPLWPGSQKLLYASRGIGDLRQLRIKEIVDSGLFNVEQAQAMYDALRRGAAFGADASRPLATMRNLGEGLGHMGVPGMEDALRTLSSLRPNTGLKWVDGPAGFVLNLPENLARFRDFVQFTLNPYFSAAKVFKTKILRGISDLPFDYNPAKRINELADASGDRAAFMDQFGSHYEKVAGPKGAAYATLLDHPDFGVAGDGSGIFGWTHNHQQSLDAWRMGQQIRSEKNIAADADLSPYQYQAINRKLQSIYGYPDRSGLMKSLNYLFFPLSFNLKLGKALAGWMLQEPARIYMVNQGLQLYNQANTNNRIGDVVDRYLPIVDELNKINVFAHGFGVSSSPIGGRNKLIWDMGRSAAALVKNDPRAGAFVPIGVADRNVPDALGLMGGLIPLWREFGNLSRTLSDQWSNVAYPLATGDWAHAGADQWQVDNYYQTMSDVKRQVAIAMGNSGLKPSFSALTKPDGTMADNVNPDFYAGVQALVGQVEAKYPAGALFAKLAAADQTPRNQELETLMRVPNKTRAQASLLYFASAYFALSAQANTEIRFQHFNKRQLASQYQVIAEAMANGQIPPSVPGSLDEGRIGTLRSLAGQLSEQAGPDFAKFYKRYFAYELGPLQLTAPPPGVDLVPGAA